MKTIKYSDNYCNEEEVDVEDVVKEIYDIITPFGATYTSCGCCSESGQDAKISISIAKKINELITKRSKNETK